MHVYIFTALLFMTMSSAVYAEETSSTPSVSSPPSVQADTSKTAGTSPAEVATEDYYCPMHPEQHGKKGDTCPICHMHLVPVPDKPEESTAAPEKPTEVSP